MFTGLVEELGQIHEIGPRDSGLRFTISAILVMDDLKIGDSISVNGVCLTVSEINNNVKLKNKKYFDYKKKSEVVSGSKLQLIIALLLSFFLFGWLYIGNKIFIFTALIPLWYIFKKIRKS